MVDFIFAAEVESAVAQEELAKLAELSQGKVVLELGSYFGRSTIGLASVAKEVHALDWHRGDPHSMSIGRDTLPVMLNHLVRHKVVEKVVMHVGDNAQVCPFLKSKSYDLIFIDSYHTKEAVENDIKLTWRLLKPGGVMAFHDYGLKERGFGVTEAVDAFV